MKRLLLSEQFEIFLYLTTGILVFITMFIGMCGDVPESIQYAIGIPAYSLLIVSAYYGVWRGIQREKEA